ncbi:M56 family metallopeptidase [Telluribacter humicola]|uniref:M56 family metallopeptidase n=1 Tax=Telluribacter humicola TaxID=1720261 RepID=UPI001A976AEB|nr:M56 family metallopeptidase [Telluribacter humicola]
MLLPYLLKVSLLLAALTLAYRWLIQYESFSGLNRVLLWLNVLAAWSLPLMPLPDWGPVAVQQEFHRAVPAVINQVPALAREVAPEVVVPIVSATAAEPQGIQVTEALLLLYLLGVVALAGRLLWQVGRMLHTLRQLPSERLEGGIRLVRDPHTDSPYSFFGWIVCNPEKHGVLELQHILAHESEHVRQWHSLDLLLAEVQRVVLWFNPFSWVHQRLVQSNLEYLADRAVLDGGYDRKQYQVNLLKAALRTHDLPLTNSFAQSLLKKRIRMMNKQPSRLWGKYMGLLAVLYLSSAFVAPYRAQLVALVPASIQPVVSAMIPESTPVQEIAPEPAPAEVPEVEPAPEPTLQVPTEIRNDSLRRGKHSKWTLVSGDTLYWVISPLATFDDINNIRNDILEYEAEMKFNSFQYDPLTLFLTNIIVSIKLPIASGQGKSEGSTYTPAKGFSGYITRQFDLGMGHFPPEPLLKAMKQDYETALKLREEHFPEYVEDSLNKIIIQKEGSFGTRTYLKKSLEGEYAPKVRDNMGIGKSPYGTLLIADRYKNAELYLNGRPSGLAEVNEVPFEKLYSVSIKSVANVDKYVLVFTK